MKRLTIVFILLVSSLFSQNRLVLNGAYINITNGANLVVDNSASNAITVNSGHIISEGENNNIKWNLGTSTGTYTVPLGYSNTNYIPLMFTKTAGTGSGSFVFSTYKTGNWQNSLSLPTGVPDVNNVSGADNSANVIDRFWKINASGYTAKPDLSNLIFTYIDGEHSVAANTIAETNLIAQRYNSTLPNWGDYLPPSVVNITSNQVTVSSLTAANLFDWWTLSVINSPLPIELLSFTATLKKDKTVDLSWTTVSELNNDYYTIEKSSDGYNWFYLTKVKGAGTTNIKQEYVFNDSQPFVGTTYYRLKQVDYDNSFTYSNIESVELDNYGNILAKPNPFTNLCYIQLDGATSINKLEIFNSIGQIVKTVSIESPDQKIIQLDFTNMAIGIYYLKADGVVLSQKLIKQ